MKLLHSRDNPFCKQLRRLAESGRERRKTGQTLLDGMHLITAWEAVHGPVETLVVMASAQAVPEIARFIEGREIVVVSDALMRDLGLVESPSGILAVVRPPLRNFTVDREKSLILLDGVQDPGNVGTLLRTAAAAGIRQAALGPGCAAAWSPKVLRAGQGAQFVLSIGEDVDLAELMQSFPGTTVVTCLEGAVPLFDATWSAPVAWVFGAEGRGVSPELAALARLRVRIPMAGEIESLNVAAAAAVCLFEGLRRELAAQPA